jgi:paraquat-inducible protein A
MKGVVNLSSFAAESLRSGQRRLDARPAGRVKTKAVVIACEFCALPHEDPDLAPGQRANCSRCGGALAKSSRSPIEATLALAITALILLVLANVLTLLSFSLSGQVQTNTIASGVVGLWTRGQQMLALLILFTTIAAPGLRILGLLYVLVPLSRGRLPRGVSQALRFQEGLVSWAMLDVYMLALLVALVKLSQMASVHLHGGAYCFVALFLVLTLIGVSYDREALWNRIEELS